MAGIVLGTTGILALSVWFLLATASGLSLLWGRIAPQLPEGIAVAEVEGRLIGPLSLTGVRFESDAADVRIGRVDLDWRPEALRTRTLDLRSLSFSDVDVTLAPADADAPPTPPLTLADLPEVTLPVTIRLAAGRATRVRVTRAADLQAADTQPAPEVGDARPFDLFLDEIVLEDVAFTDALTIRRLFVTAPEGSATLSGRVAPHGRYPLDLTAGWALIEPAATDGALTLAGDLTRLTADVEVRTPAAARLEATLEDPLGRRFLDALLTLAPTTSEQLRAAWPATDAWPGALLGGTLAVRGTPDSLDVRADLAGTTAETGPWSATADVFLEGGTAARIGRLEVRAGGGTVEAAGSVARTGDVPDLDLDARWVALRWPLVGDATVASPTGRARIRGTPEAYRLEAEATAVPTDGPETRLRLVGRGSTEALTVDRFEGEALGATATANGVVRWAPTVTWSLALGVRDLEPALVTPAAEAWPGVLALTGTTSGRSDPSGLHADLAVDTLTGELRSEPLTAALDASVRIPVVRGMLAPDQTDATIRSLVATWGPNRVAAQGVFGDTLDLTLAAEVPDAGVLHDAIDGALSLQARATGTRSEPRAQLDLTARDLASGETRAAEVDVSALIDTGPGGVVGVQATALDVSVGDHVIDTVRIVADGTHEAHRITGRLRAPQGAVDLQASGGVADGAWTGLLEGLDPQSEEWGTWRLAEGASVHLSPDSVLLDGACWTEEGATACASLTWRTEGDRTAEVTLEGLALDRYAALLPPDWTARGMLRAHGSFQLDTAMAVVGALEVDAGSGTLSYPLDDGSLRTLGFTDARWVGHVDEGGLVARFGTVVGDGNATGVGAADAVMTLDGEVVLPDFVRLGDPLPDQVLQGRLRALVTDFSALEAANPAVGSVDGEFAADVALAGSVRYPEFTGEARFTGGRATLTDLGITLEDIEFTARGQGLDGVTLDGMLRSGTGTVRITGSVPSTLTDETPARVRVAGTGFQVVNLPEAVAWISPSLETTITPAGASVTGDVVIPRAVVELAELAHTAVRPSADVVFVEDTLAVARTAAGLSLRVRVTLGDSVTFQGLGFSAAPRGTLVASEGPGGTLVGTGEVTLTGGRYRAYGQDLTIERGRVLFAGGPLDNPGLDIRATRTARDGVVAGLDVAGTLQAPDVTVFSEPAMPQSDALAYIVLGRPLGAASTSEGNLVANAATSLGLRGGNVLAGRIGQRFGLSDTRIEAEGPLDQAALVAGKYLSPRLYVSYGVGLIEPVSTFRLRYLLSGRWTLNAESGRAAGADLLYRIERGLSSP